MSVQMPLRVFDPVRGLLMEPHRVGKGSLKQIVIASGNAPQDIGQGIARGIVETHEISDVTPTTQQQLKRPYSPEGHNRCEVFIFTDNTLARGAFEFNIVAEQTPLVPLAVLG